MKQEKPSYFYYSACLFCLTIAVIPLQQAIVFRTKLYVLIRLAYIPVKNDGIILKLNTPIPFIYRTLVESYKITPSQKYSAIRADI